MKHSLAFGKSRVLTRDAAWAACLANVGLPGSGSLMARRWSGYPQVLAALAGLALSMLYGTRAIIWFLQNWARLHDPGGDPWGNLAEMWRMLKWPMAGIGLFALAWLWALVTSLLIMRDAKRAAGKLPGQGRSAA